MKIIVDLNDNEVRTKMVLLYLESIGVKGHVTMSHQYIENKLFNEKYFNKIICTTEDK